MTWQQARPGLEPARHRGGVRLRRRSWERPGAAHRQCRPGRARSGRPDPDRGLQDVQDGADRRRRGAARPARGLSAGGPAGAFAARGGGGRPARRRRTRLSPAVRRGRQPAEGLSASLAGRRAVPAELAGRRGRSESRPGCIGGWPRRRPSSGPNGTRPGSGRPAGTARSAGSCPAQPSGQQVVR